ncbi:MAG: phenylacetate--CoA ligase [Actinomycetia bacterium]|nr:phenylacetate--CoA ligase [Actinomycetes bacterium]
MNIQQRAAQPIFNPKFECASRDEIRCFQLQELRKQVAWAYEKVDYYRQNLDAAGIEPGDIKGFEDFSKLPLTDKTALRDNYPYGLFAVPLDQIIRIHASSGTTGKPIVVGYTRQDVEEWRYCIMAMIQQAGVVPGDRAQMAFGYGMFTGGFGLHYGLEGLGCMMIPASAGNTERHLMMIEDYGTTVLVATPSYAMHICEVGEELGFDWQKSTLRVGLFGGEPCPPKLKSEIEKRMYITCTDNYGLTEVMGPGVSGECLTSRDQQHIMEDHFYWEVIDPESGAVLPEGAEGELVLTPLQKQGVPLLRYRTHDLTSVTTVPCGCGRTTARMNKVRHRSDDMLIIRGTNVYPSQIEDVLADVEGASAHYRLLVDDETGLDRLTVMLELLPFAFTDSFAEMESFRVQVADKLKGVLQVSVEVKLVEPGSIERTMGKTQHLEDKRKR